MDVRLFLNNGDAQVVIPLFGPLDCDGLNGALKGAMGNILVGMPHDGDAVRSIMEFVPRLFQSERGIVLLLLETGRRFPAKPFLSDMIEERLTELVDSLRDFLYDLAAEGVPIGILRQLLQFCEVYLQLIRMKIYTVHPVIATMERDTVIPYLSGHDHGIVQMLILFAVVHAVLIGSAYGHGAVTPSIHIA